MNLIDKVKSYVKGVEILSTWVGSGGDLVEVPQAQYRANTCLICPKHVPCGTLEKAVALGVKKIVGLKGICGLKVRGEHRLKCCSVCGCVMRTKIWMPLSRAKAGMSPEEISQLDTKCWITNE